MARVVSRLSTLGPTRIDADLLAPAAQRLADLAAVGEGRPSRPVPDLAAHGWADLLIVLAHDLLAAGPPEDLLARAHDELVRLRRALP